MAILYFSEHDVERLLDMPTAIDAMEEAFRELAAGRADNVPRTRASAAGIVLHSMSAAADYLGLVGWKQYTTTARGARFHVGLYDQTTGDPVALIEANRLGQMRTGAVTGLAAKRLAPPNTQSLGVIGSGWQAESQLAAVATACPLRRAVVYSRDPERRTQFARRMSADLDLDVTAVDHARQAVEEMQVVVTATTSRQPVLDGDWLSPGTLVCAVGSNWLNKAELDLKSVSRAAQIVCDSVGCCRIEAGDFVAALEQGSFDWQQAIPLADVVAGHTAGRNDSAEIVIFKSVGMAIEDLALGSKLLGKWRGDK